MCSVEDDSDQDSDNDGKRYLPLKSASLSKETKCNKCRTETPCILLRGKDAYCKNCFLAGTNHKFKALLGKSRLIRPKDKVLVSYEVGHPSTALLHLLRAGLDLDTPKKLRFDPCIVFLEDQYHLTVQERVEMSEKVINQTNLFDFKCYFVSFSDSVTNPTQFKVMQNNFKVEDTDKAKLDSLIGKKCNETNRMDILRILKRDALLLIAKKLDCKFIFTSELSLDIASSLLTNISLGRGAHVPVDTGFCDDRDPDIKILRPLRNFDIKELAFYNVLHNLEPVHVKQPDSVNPYASVQNLMKTFVTDLQQNFPATVTTIVKTGDKLALDSEQCRKCKLCKGIILKKSFDLTSEESTNFSKLVSTSFQDPSISGSSRFTQIANNFKMEESQEYCYSCAKIAEYLIEEP